jgi:hypothetical protein
MGFSISGYVLEPPRVGGSNSPFTSTPNDFVSDPGTYNAYYTSAEDVPRDDYLVVVMTQGKLPAATFGWTKNEGLVVEEAAVQRFDYDSTHQRFYPLPGGPATTVGVLGSTSNTQRLSVAVPIGVTSAAPFRLSIGTTGSGTTQTVSLVSSFGSPPPGTTELMTIGSNAGQLNWNSSDLATYAGQTVRFQQQAPFSFTASDGNIGLIGNNTLLLNPIPGDTQYPVLRIGYGLWLTAVEVPNESSFSPNPTAGTVQWALTTGLLKFNSTDISDNAGTPVYYDGVLISANLSLPTQSLGTVNPSGVQGTVLSPIPSPGGDIIFRIPGVIDFQEAISTQFSDFNYTGKQSEVQYDPTTGQVLLSLADRTTYSGQPLSVTLGDLAIERGISMRFFRTPVDLSGTDASVNDVSAIYTVTGATWASPMIQSPIVSLPSTPIESSSYPITVTVSQGTGTFTGTLPNLQQSSPPAGLGYVIDYDAGQLQYAFRLNSNVSLFEQSTPAAILNPLIVDSELDFAIETSPGSGFYNPFTQVGSSNVFVTSSGLGGILDTTAGQFAFTQVAGTQYAASSSGSFSGPTFTDTSQNFTTDGVTPGDFLVVQSGASEGVYGVSAVGTTTLTTDVPGITSSDLDYEVLSSKEVLADRFFEQVVLVDPNTRVERINSLGVITNSPRLSIPITYVGVTRFRYGSAPVFSTTVNIVSNDAAFSNPAILPSGTVEISAATGDLNFSSADLTGGTVYWSRTLVQNVDYTIAAYFGTISFTDRFLALEEAYVTYTSTENPSVVIMESATFLVRKELTQPHPLPTSTLSFNPLGRTVATTPTQAVFRGGRPQVLGTQCTVDTANSTITFLSDSILTDALPHGATIAPTENVYIDYYIYQAIGGEQNITVQNPPINLAQVSITSDQSSLTITGDYSDSFPVGYLLRVDSEQIYLIASSSYASGFTTVTIGETFTDDYTNPTLYVSSGPLPTTGTPTVPSYFVTELSQYNAIAQGMNAISVVGDRTSSYKTGTIILLGSDYYEATGATYDSSSNLTQVTLTRNTVQQYTTTALKYSVRPVLEATTTTVSTQYPPITTQSIIVWRRVEGQPGVILTSPTDYTMDAAGNVTLATPLQSGEEVSIFYTGSYSVQAGLHFKASYTYVTTPTTANGLLNQILLADYSTFNPDNFYFRVETMTNFRAEYEADIQADATSNVPSGGPTTSNASQPVLYEQGKPSLYFNEGHYANQDIIARSVLVYYNSAINYLEAVLTAMDGRVVGDSDGLFVFDGVIGRTISGFPPTGVLNQIDDLIQVSPFPLPNGTYQQIYLNGPYSRFFKTKRNVFTTSPALAGVKEGDHIAQYTFQALSSLPGVTFKRWPRAQIQFDYPAGTSTFTVDNATGTDDSLQRPSFITGMQVVIEDSLGNVYLSYSANAEVASFSSTSITLSSSVPLDVPAGATIYMSPTDASSRLNSSQNGYQMLYQFGKDVNADLLTGELLYVPAPAVTFPLFPTINPVQAGDILQANEAGVSVTYLTPYRFPALDGETTDDDGDQAVPLIGPTFDGEIVPSGGGPLNVEALNEVSTSTFRTSTTTPTFVGMGSLNLGGTVITLTSGIFPSPVPKLYDLVRITSGLNAGSSWRQITSVPTSTTITVSDAFTLDSGFTFDIAVSSTTVSGTASLSGTSFSDSLATFESTVQVGWTVVMTSGPNAGLRRQIVAIASNTILTLSSAFTSGTGGTYRVDNPLDTYTGSVLTELQEAVSTLLTAVTNENTAILNFLGTVFTTEITSTTGSVSGTSLTDGSQDFTNDGVTTSDFVYVQTGANAGVYAIASINSPTGITVASAFPSSGSLPSYEIVSTFGVSLATLQVVLNIYLQNVTFLSDTTTFSGLLSTTVPVLGDSGATAYGYLPSDLNNRYTIVTARQTALTGYITSIETPLTSSDRLYDARYIWISERIDKQSGLLVLEQMAVANRIAAQADVVNQLTKLLALQDQ